MSNFQDRIKARRAIFGRKGLRRKPPAWLYPYALEREYANKLISLVEALDGEARRQLIDNLPTLVGEADRELRADRFIDDVKSLLLSFAISAANYFEPAERVALDMAVKIAAFNGVQYSRIVQATLGVDPIQNDAYLDAHLRLFAQQNAALIKSIPERITQDIEGVIYRGLRGGQTPATITEEIRSRIDVGKSRARLIARDQVGKLNAQLTEIRQKRIGITEYYWSTVHDERVRSSHKVLDGKICRWDDPSVYRNPGDDEWRSRSSLGAFVGNPGEDYQCRCFSDPIMDDLIGVSENG